MLNFHLEAVDIFVSHYNVECLVMMWKLSTTCTRGRDLRRRIREALPLLCEHFVTEANTLYELTENIYKVEFDKVVSLYSHPKWALSHFAESGNWSMIRYTMKRGFDDLNVGLRGAARGGWMDVIEFFLTQSLSGNYYSGITGAVSGSRQNIQEFFLKKIEQNDKRDSDSYRDAVMFGLLEKYACHQDLENEVSEMKAYYSYDLICGLAIAHGDVELVDFLITEKDVERDKDLFSCILFGGEHISIKTDKIAMLDYLLEKFRQNRQYFDLIGLLTLAVEQDERELFFYIYREYPRHIHGCESNLAVLCIELDRLELFYTFVEKKRSLEWCMKRAIILGKIDFVRILSEVCKNYNMYMIEATEVNNVELVRYFCSKGSRTHELCLDHAIRYNFQEIVHYFQVERYT